MEYQINKLEDSTVEIWVKLDEEEMEESYFEAEKALREEERIREMMSGSKKEAKSQERLLEEKSLTIAVSNSYHSIREKENLEFIGQPVVRITKFIPRKDLEYTLKVAVLPEIKLPDYFQIAKEVFSEKEAVEVSEKEVEEALEWLRHARARIKEVEKKAEEGDFVEIEYDVFDEKGKKMVSNNDAFELGKGAYVPGFEANIVGLEKGEKKEFSLEVPENWPHKQWRGKKLKITVKVNLVGEKEIPELNDEFARSLGNFSDLEALRKSIAEGLKMEKEEAQKEKKRLLFLEKVRERMEEIVLPEILVNSQVEKNLEQIKKSLEKANVDLNTYLETTKKTEEDLRNDLAKEARVYLLNALILREIAKENKIEPTDEEIQEYAQRILSQYPVEVVENIPPNDLREIAKEKLVFNKCFEFLEKFAEE